MHPGSLRRWAKRHKAMNKDGSINLAKAQAEARKEYTKEPEYGRYRLKQVRLAYTLRRANR